MQVIQVRGATAPRVFELELLVTTTIDTLTPSLVLLLEYLYDSEVEDSSYAMNVPEDDFEPPNKLRKP